jgi:hypothetical protein
MNDWTNILFARTRYGKQDSQDRTHCDERKEQREIYQNKQDDNDDIEIDCDSGFAYDGYCPCGNSMDLYITGDGDVWMNDCEVVFNIFNWVHVYKNGQEVEI